MAEDTAGSEADTDASILSVYENLFKDRYSDTDEEYQNLIKNPKPPPPAVKNWFPKQNRHFDRNRGGWRGRGQGQHYHQRERDRDNYNRNYGHHGDRRHDYHQQHRHYGQQHGRGYHGNRGYHGDQRGDRRYHPY